MGRTYDNSKRAAAARQTTERIAEATENLVAERALGEVTLQAIAERAGVTVQTVLRHMGSRDGCLDAARHRVTARIEAQRGHTAPGDVDAALQALLLHYERDGRLVLQLLAQETSDPFAREAVEEGRAYHRAWVERCFGPGLAVGDRQRSVDALVAATDLFVWKLLRLDLSRTPQDTADVIDHLVRAILERT